MDDGDRLGDPGGVDLCLQDVFPDHLGYGTAISGDRWQDWFNQWLHHLDPQLAPAYELTLRLTDDDEIQQLNREYRQCDRPTDVLAFALLDSGISVPEHAPFYLGDIIISVETAHRQAGDRGHSAITELSWLAIHGLLHLLGWDHPNEERLQEMIHCQATCLRLIGLEPPEFE